MEKIGKIGYISNDIVERNIFFIKEKLDEIIDHENELIDFIQSLLDEKEREVLNSMREWVVEYHKDNWDIRDFDAEIAIGKIIDRELSKLSKKK